MQVSMVLTSDALQIIHNIQAAWEQEYALATAYYEWACSQPIYGRSSVSRYRDASDRLNRAKWRVHYAECV